MPLFPAPGHRIHQKFSQNPLTGKAGQKGGIKKFPAHQNVHHDIIFSGIAVGVDSLGIENTHIPLDAFLFVAFNLLGTASRPHIGQLNKVMPVGHYSTEPVLPVDSDIVSWRNKFIHFQQNGIFFCMAAVCRRCRA